MSKVTFAGSWGLGACSPSLAVCSQHTADACMARHKEQSTQCCSGLLFCCYFFPATQVVPVDLWILRCSRGAAKGDPKILNLPVTGCAFLSPPSSSVPGKRGDSQPCSVPAEAGGALASGDPAVSHSARTLSVPWPGYFWAQ